MVIFRKDHLSKHPGYLSWSGLQVAYPWTVCQGNLISGAIGFDVMVYLVFLAEIQSITMGFVTEDHLYLSAFFLPMNLGLPESLYRA